MSASTQIVQFDGQFLSRGFWLYAWEVSLPSDTTIVYVGRTGDSSSPHAQSPFNRMGQHLGRAVNSSMLRNHLDKQGADPDQCRYRLIAHGPVLPEVATKEMADHKVSRDVVAAMEKQLATDLKDAGYDVVNTVTSKKLLDPDLYAPVRAAFAKELTGLSAIEGGAEGIRPSTQRRVS